MPTLKSLIDATIKAGSKWTMPSGTAVTIGTMATHANDSESWADGLNYIAPHDGIVVAFNLQFERTHIKGSAIPQVEYDIAVQRYYWTFARKGTTIKFFAFNPTAETTCYFYPLLGQA